MRIGHLLALLAALPPLAYPESAGAEGSFLWKKPWSKPAELVEVLELVPEGRALLEAARKKEPGIEKRILPGEASFTERAFRGAYSALSGKEQVSQRLTVHIRRALPLSDAALDLGHELEHLARREPLDPYSPSFSLPSFVRAGIEGEGGELPAFEAECRLARALEKAQPAFPAHPYCVKFRAPGGAFDREAARLAYWAVGKKRKQLPAALLAEAKELSEGEPLLVSGTDRRPYPFTLAAEYEQIRKAACANNKWKFSKLKQMPAGGRDRDSASVKEEVKKMEEMHQRLCR